MKNIELNKGNVAIVDDADYERLSQFKWFERRGYAARNVYKKGVYITIWLHREIICPPPGNEVDHINGNKLDNRRENLRIVTHSQNMKNTYRRHPSSSKHKGVSWFKESKKWMANINSDGKRYYLGLFEQEEEAARAYNDAAQRLHREFAKLNNV